MTALAPLLEAFFTERLIGQRHVSPHTVAAYRDAVCLLLRFAERSTGRKPHQLGLEDLDAGLIGAFLNHLDAERGVSVRTRNARLTAIRSLFNFAAAADLAGDEQDFLDRLRTSGLLVRPRASITTSNQYAGHAVALPDDHNAAGDPIWYSGSTLAADLSPPKLRRRWRAP
jgi:hypothetical protein